jgi:hypothetical protein
MVNHTEIEGSQCADVLSDVSMSLGFYFGITSGGHGFNRAEKAYSEIGGFSP